MREKLDRECICCKRLYFGSCDGSEDRGRNNINIHNRCPAYLYVDNESDCNGDDKLYNHIKDIEKEIGI